MRCLRSLDGRLVETGIEIARMYANQFFPAVAQTDAGLAIDVENYRFIVNRKKASVAWSAKARKRISLLRSSFSACLRSVMSCRTPNWRKGRPDSSHVTSPWL